MKSWRHRPDIKIEKAEDNVLELPTTSKQLKLIYIGTHKSLIGVTNKIIESRIKLYQSESDQNIVRYFDDIVD